MGGVDEALAQLLGQEERRLFEIEKQKGFIFRR